MSDVADAKRSPRTWVARPTAQRACGHCGKPFVPSVPSMKYCSSTCRVEVEEARRQRRTRPTPLKEEG